MPVNRLALVRYKTIDNCLRNPYRKWTLLDLVEACSQALYEFEGKEQGVSLRTVQLDIQNMRSDKLGYAAPIVVVDKKYYTYAEPDYSINNMPLTADDIQTLLQITRTLRQFEGFKQFSDTDALLRKIESKVFALHSRSNNIIDFEKNNQLTGIQFLDILYRAIKEKVNVRIIYKAFGNKTPNPIYLSPYLLKEYRNRWFVFGKRKNMAQIYPLALDRIQKVHILPEHPYIENTFFDPETYFDDIIGVTKYEDRPKERIEFWVDTSQVPYVQTKPFHRTQQMIEETAHGAVFIIEVIPNLEMEREFFGFGELLKITKPSHLHELFEQRVEKMASLYRY